MVKTRDCGGERVKLCDGRGVLLWRCLVPERGGGGVCALLVLSRLLKTDFQCPSLHPTTSGFHLDLSSFWKGLLERFSGNNLQT